jgi:hypothetical protein
MHVAMGVAPFSLFSLVVMAKAKALLVYGGFLFALPKEPPAAIVLRIKELSCRDGYRIRPGAAGLLIAFGV